MGNETKDSNSNVETTSDKKPGDATSDHQDNDNFTQVEQDIYKKQNQAGANPPPINDPHADYKK